MTEKYISVQVFLGNKTLTEWNTTCSSSLPELLNAIEHSKKFINDFLTDIITKTKDHPKEVQLQWSESETSKEDFPDEDQEDPFEGVLKEIVKSAREKYPNSESNHKRKNINMKGSKRKKN